MEKLQETKRWKELEDKIAEVEYRKICGLDFAYITPKNKKIKMAIILKGKDHAYWNKLSSKQLGAILNKTKSSSSPVVPKTAPGRTKPQKTRKGKGKQ